MMSNRGIAMFTALIMGGLACGDSTSYGGGGGGGGNPPTGDVVITPGADVKTTTAYSPNPFTVALNGGASVNIKFANQDNISHSVTQDGGSPTFTHDFTGGSTFTFAFTTAGTYTYHCHFHPGMVGSITVSP